MFYLGYKNWIRYGWTQDLNSYHTDYASFVIDFSNYDKTEKYTAIDSALLTIDKIVEEYPPPYTLMCSGGVDSQSMLYSWLKSGKDFTVVSARYVSNGIWFNDYDLNDLNKFAIKHNIDIKYIDINIINFLENDLTYISKKYDCDSPQICTHIKMTDSIDRGTILFSGNVTGPDYGNTIDYTLMGMHRFALSLNESKRVVPFFFIHTPELVYSFISEHSIKEVKAVEDKFTIYSKNGFDIVKPNRKYTGFESLKNYYDQFQTRVDTRSRLLYASMPSQRVFDLLFRYPLCNKKGAYSGTYIPICKFA